MVRLAGLFLLTGLFLGLSTALDPNEAMSKMEHKAHHETSTAISGDPSTRTSTRPAPAPNLITWYLLGLRGNTTLVHQRMDDFLLFLRITVASLTSCQFESVLVNHVSYNPVLLLNISITGVHSVSSLQQLAARQDSLFLLSYTPFHVTQFTSKEDILVARPVVDSLATSGREEEALLYLGLGAGLAFMGSGGTLVCVLLLLASKRRGRDREPLLNQKRSASGSGLNSMLEEPPVTIYSASFSQDLAQGRPLLPRLHPLEASLCPINDTEVDFSPRYLRQEDSFTWLSSPDVSFHHEPGCRDLPNVFRPSLPTFSETESVKGEDTGSPGYWQRSPTPRPSIASRPPLARRAPPPRPPGRTDSLNPYNRAKNRAISGIPLEVPLPSSLHTPGLPHRVRGRPLSLLATSQSSAPWLQHQMEPDVCQLDGVPSFNQLARFPSSSQLAGDPSSKQLAGVPSSNQLCALPPEADVTRCLTAAGISGSGKLSPISH